MKRLTAILLAVAMLMILAACGGGNTTQAPAAEEAPAAEPSNAGDSAPVAGKEDVYVAYSSIASSALAIWSGYLETNLKAECDERGWQFRALSAEGDVELQGEQITQLINTDPDVIVIFPGDPQAAADWVVDVNDAGIPCILVGQNVPESARENVTAFVGSDQVEMCANIAQMMVEKNGADAGLNIVCISGVPVQQDYIDREKGLNEYLAENSNYTVLATEYAFSSRSDAKDIMNNYISTYGEDGIDAVVAYEDDLLMGALQAIEEAGLTGKLQVYGVAPAMREAMDQIVAGNVLTDVLMSTKDIMETTASVIEQVASGNEVDYMNVVPLYYVTQENVNDYMDMVEY